MIYDESQGREDRYDMLTGDISEQAGAVDVEAIGDRIRSIREEKGISHEEMARFTGFDVEMLSKMEANEIQPQLGMLVKLSKALDSAFARLVTGEDGSRAYSVTRKDERKPVTRSTSPKGKQLYTYQSLAPEVQGRHMEALIVNLEENPEKEISVHDGEEFIYVLENAVVVKVEEDEFELGPGDCVYYQSNVPHMVAAKKGSAKILAVLYEG